MIHEFKNLCSIFYSIIVNLLNCHMRAACGYVCRPVARGGGVRWVRSLLYESSLWVCMQACSQRGGGGALGAFIVI